MTFFFSALLPSPGCAQLSLFYSTLSKQKGQERLATNTGKEKTGEQRASEDIQGL